MHFQSNPMKIFGMLLFLFFMCLPIGYSHPTSIDDDGMLKIDGERTFILGLYENAKDEKFAKEVKSAGFNLIRAGASQESLDLAHEAGLQCWIPLGGIAVSSDSEKEKLRAILEAFENHPALAVWEGPDEVLWNVWWLRWNRAIRRWNEVEKAIDRFQGNAEKQKALKALEEKWRRFRSSARYAQMEEVEEEIRALVGLPSAPERLSEWRTHLDSLYEQLSAGTRVVREEDPNHVIWFNHAPRNSMKDLTRFGKVADIVGCDIYPVPFGPQVGHSDLRDRNLTSVGAFTRRMAESAPGKPVWMVLQGFGWDDLSETSSEREPRPRPTLEQTRFMAYDAIVNGARGILFWGTHAVEKDSQLWDELKRVVSELHSLQPFLAAPDITGKYSLTVHPSSGSDEKGIIWLAKENNEQVVFIVVNEADQGLAFEISGLENGETFVDLHRGEKLLVEEGKISFGVSALGSAVLIFKF